MKLLLDDKFAPITGSVGYLRVPLDAAAAALAGWRNELEGTATITHLSGPLDVMLSSLEPLVTGARPRELLVEMRGGWTAYFDSLLQGTDPWTTIGYLARTIPCEGAAITLVPDVRPSETGTGRLGAVQLQTFEPYVTDFINHGRHIGVVHDGDRWDFSLSGEPLPFEEHERYKAQRVRDRFTPEMLASYASALGIDFANADAYGPRGTLVEVPLVSRYPVMSLAEARVYWGLDD
jgi:hypothetical protein